MSHDSRRDLILSDLKRRYQKDPNVLGMIFFGSQAQGCTDEFSDLDVYVILSKDDGRKRIYKRIQSLRVDILFDSVESIANYLQREEGKLWRNVSHMLASGKVLFSRSSKLSQIQRRAKGNLAKKTRMTKNEKLLHIYSIEDYWYKAQRDAKNGDVVAFQRDASCVLNNAIELFLKAHGDYLRPARELDAELKRIDKIFENRVLSFYKTSDFQRRLLALRAVVQYVAKRFGKMPDTWTVKKQSV
jgi:predicted nucleotidyltransferase